MPKNARPCILIVDDKPTKAYEVGLNNLAASRSRHPNEVEGADLTWADLVLVDFSLDDWTARDEIDTVSLRPLNGLALAAVLREHADASNGTGHSYTAFAIHSGHIGDISTRLHTTNRTPYVIARLNNLEWAFNKDDESRFQSAAALARAVRSVSDCWSEIEVGGSTVAASRLLLLPKNAEWSSRAEDDIVLCQAPLSGFSAGTNGLLFLRWLLHGILPYPTFLLAKHWVAAHFRITPGSLEQVLKGESQLAIDLASLRYTGILEDFCGFRWWRAGIEQYTWEIRASGARGLEEFHSVLERRAECSLHQVEEVSPVVCVDRDLKPRDELQALETAVRLVPDLWPAYADAAYAAVTLVNDDIGLRSIVHPLDRARLSSADEEE